MTTKIVIIIANGTPAPIAANTAAILSMTIGARHPDLIGDDTTDADGHLHRGISGTPIPILTAPTHQLHDLATTTATDIETIGFTTTAAHARDYATYTAEINTTPTHTLEYLGIALIGPTKTIRSLTGSLPLLR